MASESPADEDRRSRIISHMNRCHTRELAHFLRHFAAVSARDAASASMHDVTLHGMRIHAAGIDHVVPFQHPLDSWSDVKQQIIDMDKVARQHLGVSDIIVTEYVPPDTLDSLVNVGLLLYFFCHSAIKLITPNTAVWNKIDAVVPGGAERLRWLINVIFFPVLVVHIAETVLMDRKLMRHGVQRWTWVWTFWVIAGFSQGIMAFWRLDRHVALKRANIQAKASKGASS